MNDIKPLVIDLDGTLIHGDLLFESILGVIKQNPLNILLIAYWIFSFKRKAILKRKIAIISKIDISKINYNQELIYFIKERKKTRTIILCSGTDQIFLEKINEYIGLFDQVIGSNGQLNLVGKNKENCLVEKYGYKGYDYVGNSIADLPVWKSSDKGYIITKSNNLLYRAKLNSNIESLPFTKLNATYLSLGRLIRPHQWLKNLLILVPLITAHSLPSISDTYHILLAITSFSLCASAVYILNDLFDLENDRSHQTKKFRPLAAGEVAISDALILCILLLLMSVIIGKILLSNEFVLLLLSYLLITIFYTLKIKSISILDCFTLGILYTMRTVAGAIVLNLSVSFWLLAFSFFLFLSLALIKRFSEIVDNRNIVSLPGRGYSVDDKIMIQTLGISVGCISALIFALYLNSVRVALAFYRGEILFIMVPLILFWISHMWNEANRGRMHSDPLVFAVKNRVSQVVGIIAAILIIIAKCPF